MVYTSFRCLSSITSRFAGVGIYTSLVYVEPETYLQIGALVGTFIKLVSRYYGGNEETSIPEIGSNTRIYLQVTYNIRQTECLH